MLQNLPPQNAANQPFLSFRPRNLVFMGGCEYRTDLILSKILDISNGEDVYLHGSNSSSLQMFKNQETPGALLPRSRLKEQGVNCQSGECTQSQFNGAYGENGHSCIFSYKLCSSEFYIKKAAEYADYNTSENMFFPVIYILDINSEFSECGYGEYCSKENECIPPQMIKSILAPRHELPVIQEMLGDNFPNIKLISIN